MTPDEGRALERYFDKQFYLSAYPDVAAAGIDPIEHYHEYGWREGRDPSPRFSTQYYLRAHADVAAANVNPLLHYTYAGKSEGRAVRDSSSDMGLLASEFDEAYYRHHNADVIKSGVDPLWHFCNHGWMEGRNPSDRFDVVYYLSANQDVDAAGINPLLHYVLSGRAEGRHPRRLLDDERREIENSIGARKKISRQIEDIAYWSSESIDLPALLGNRNLIVSFSHDNYLESYGGVQNVLVDEVQEFLAAGWDYLHLSPAAPVNSIVPLSLRSEFRFSIQLNGQHICSAPSGAVIAAVKEVSNCRTVQVIVHHIMGHVPEIIGDIIEAGKCQKSIFWLHDFFSLCPSYSLLRNNVLFCGAPALDSQACTICAFGKERPLHVARVEQLLLKGRWLAVAPSESALSTFTRLSRSLFADAVAWPIARLSRAHSGVRRSSVTSIRIAHLGARAYHKGWAAFSSLAERFSGDSRYTFLQIGVGSGLPINSNIEHVEVRVSASDRNAMMSAVSDLKIDVAFIWPTWPETFNFVVHEALAAGAFVITNSASGNVWPAVQKFSPKQGAVYGDLEQVVADLSSGAIFDLLNNSSLQTASIQYGHQGISKIVELSSR